MSESAYVAAVLADSPAAYWKMNETSGLPLDSSGNGKDMTSSSGTIRSKSPGPFADTGSTGLDINTWCYRSIVNTTDVTWTVEAMVAVRSWSGAFGYPISWGDPSAGGAGNGCAAGINGSTHKMVAVDHNQGVWAESSTVLSLCTWYMLTWVRTGKGASGGHYYVNGAADGNVTTFGPSGGPTGNTLMNRTEPFLGLGQSIDAFYGHVSVYNTALSSTRVAAHWTAAASLSGSPCITWLPRIYRRT